MVPPICSSVQLPFIYLNLSVILITSGRFSCSRQVSYHTFVYYFITRIRATGLAKRKLPLLFIQILSIVSRRTRHPIGMPLFLLKSNLDLSLLLFRQLQGCTTAKAHPIGSTASTSLLSLRDSHH